MEQVRQAQNLGFSLKGIKPLLKAYGSATLTAEQTVYFLEQRLAVIRTKQDKLRQIEAFICTKLDRYRKSS
ncbi:MerR family DNA-binding protein [Beijerinckia sp. L45]|uniref:MerR family DNA-binding protein n=1 Tax=Beijerinckia sp. L45 TaxID=1641855 RepID=UPI001AEE89BA